MRYGTRLLSAFLALCIVALPVLPCDAKKPAAVTVLGDNLAPIVAHFNAASGEMRFLAILSPT